MRLGEVCLLTNDVPRLAEFYCKLFGVENSSDDMVHRTLVADEVSITVYNDGAEHSANGGITLAFTTSDVNADYVRLIKMDVKIIAPPKQQPWGAINMSFYDPDGNVIYLRQFS